MRLLVLAGGFGTRLKEVVSDLPKALAPIGGTPFLQFQIQHWLSHGLREFTFLLHHQADMIIDFLRLQAMVLPKDCRIDWVIESQPLDTGGAVAHAIKKLNLKGSFLLANGDTWLSGNFSEILRATAPAIAVINISNAARYGKVQFNANRNVTSFSEKDGQTTSGWINSGMCFLNTDLFENWDGNPLSLERDLFPALVISRQLSVVPLCVDFVDIGVPEDYHRFCRWALSGKRESLCN